jgi:hypothetical protein
MELTDKVEKVENREVPKMVLMELSLEEEMVEKEMHGRVGKALRHLRVELVVLLAMQLHHQEILQLM